MAVIDKEDNKYGNRSMADDRVLTGGAGLGGESNALSSFLRSPRLFWYR